MRKHITAASATLALILGAVSACGGSPAASSSNPAGSCVNASAPHHAWVVVEHFATRQLQKCVGFAGDTIDGETLMNQSGIEYQSQTFSFGKAICQIDNEPVQFSKCFADNGPNWALFVETSGAWAEAQTGYTQVFLRDKEALGWHYTAAASPAPPALPKV